MGATWRQRGGTSQSKMPSWNTHVKKYTTSRIFSANPTSPLGGVGLAASSLSSTLWGEVYPFPYPFRWASTPCSASVRASHWRFLGRSGCSFLRIADPKSTKNLQKIDQPCKSDFDFVFYSFLDESSVNQSNTRTTKTRKNPLVV